MSNSKVPMFSYDQLYRLNKPLSKSLFVEFMNNANSNPDNAILTLAREDREVNGVSYPSLYRLYHLYADEDPTEYTFAMEVFGTWDFWENLACHEQVKVHVERMREENRIRQKSKAVRIIMNESVNPRSKSKFTAAKFLYEQGYVTRNPKGRDTANEDKEEKGKVISLVEQDARRLGLSVVK